MSSLKDLILGADDLKYEDVTIPEWGDVTIRVMAFTDEQLGAWRAKSQALRAKQRNGDQVDMEVEMKHRRAELLVQCLRDPVTEQRIFTDKDAVRLAQKNSGIMAGLDRLATYLSGLDRDFRQEVKDAEEDFSDGQS